MNNEKNKKLLGLLMKAQYDDIRNAETMADYATQAKTAGADGAASFFAQRAKSRISAYDEVQRHVDNVLSEMKGQEEDGGDDTFRCAYTEHLSEWVGKIRDKVSRM